MTKSYSQPDLSSTGISFDALRMIQELAYVLKLSPLFEGMGPMAKGLRGGKDSSKGRLSDFLGSCMSAKIRL